MAKAKPQPGAQKPHLLTQKEDCGKGGGQLSADTQIQVPLKSWAIIARMWSESSVFLTQI